MPAREVVYDPSAFRTAPPDEAGSLATGGNLVGRLRAVLGRYIAANGEATAAQLNYWDAEDALAAAEVRVRVQTMDRLAAEAGKLTVEATKARVELALREHAEVAALRDRFRQCRADREEAQAHLSVRRECLAVAKAEVDLQVAAGR